MSIFRDEVRHIERGVFKLWNVINCLELSVIRKQTIDCLQNLRKLDLTNNDILHTQEGAFNGLDNLLFLDLRHSLIMQKENKLLQVCYL